MGKSIKQANGERSPRLRADGRWEYKVMVGYKANGSPFRKSFYGKTQAEAKKQFQEFQAKRHSGIIVKAQTMTLGELVERWLEQKRERDAVSENTYQQYKYGVSKFSVLYKQRLDNITSLQIDQIYSQMLKSGLSPRSVQVAHRSLACMARSSRLWRGS